MATESQLEASAPNVLSTVEQKTDPVEKFCIIWTQTVNPILELVKKFTGKKTDAKIEKLQELAKKVCSKEDGAREKFCAYWPTIEPILKAIMILTGPKVDKALLKFIEIADNLCND